MQFFAVPGGVTLIGLMTPSASASVPSLPAATTTQKSRFLHTNASSCRHWAS
jgi:hypothetical protein